MLNQVNLIGRLGQDPEFKQVSDDFSVCNFSLAVTGGKIKGENVTEWLNIKCFNKTAENAAKYLKKGSKAYISGMIQTEKYTKDGQDRFITKIAASNITFLDEKPKQDERHTGGQDFSKSSDPWADLG